MKCTGVNTNTNKHKYKYKHRHSRIISHSSGFGSKIGAFLFQFIEKVHPLIMDSFP